MVKALPVALNEFLRDKRISGGSLHTIMKILCCHQNTDDYAWLLARQCRRRDYANVAAQWT